MMNATESVGSMADLVEELKNSTGTIEIGGQTFPVRVSVEWDSLPDGVDENGWEKFKLGEPRLILETDEGDKIGGNVPTEKEAR